MNAKYEIRAPADEKWKKISVVGSKNKIAPLTVTGTGGIFHAHSPCLKVERETHVWAEFRIIFIAAMLLGVPIPFSLWRTKRQTANTCIAAWNHCMIFARTVLTAFHLWNSGLIWTIASSQIVFGLQIFAGYANIWISCLQHGQIETSLGELLSMFPPPSSGEKGRGLYIVLTMLLCALMLTVFVWTSSVFFFCGAFDSITERRNLGRLSRDDARYYFLTAVIFSYVFTYNIGTATIYVQLMVCSQAYWSCGRLLRLYGEELLSQMGAPRLSVDVVSRMSDKFKGVSSCIQNAEQTLSSISFVIYLFVMNDVFTIMSAMYTKDREYASIELTVYLWMRVTSVTFIFLYLSQYADALAREKKALQKSMIQVSCSVMRPTTDTRLTEVFYNLYSSIGSTDLCVTCLDLFEINRKTILSGLECLSRTVFGYGSTHKKNESRRSQESKLCFKIAA